MKSIPSQQRDEEIREVRSRTPIQVTYLQPADPKCHHRWESNVETTPAVRWTCTKCGGSYLS